MKQIILKKPIVGHLFRFLGNTMHENPGPVPDKFSPQATNRLFKINFNIIHRWMTSCSKWSVISKTVFIFTHWYLLFLISSSHLQNVIQNKNTPDKTGNILDIRFFATWTLLLWSNHSIKCGHTVIFRNSAQSIERFVYHYGLLPYLKNLLHAYAIIIAHTWPQTFSPSKYFVFTNPAPQTIQNLKKKIRGVPYERTGITQQIVAFRNYADASKTVLRKKRLNCSETGCSGDIWSQVGRSNSEQSGEFGYLYSLTIMIRARWDWQEMCHARGKEIHACRV